MICQYHRHHRLDHWHGAWNNAWIVSSASSQLCLFPRSRHRVLSFGDSRCRFESDSHYDVLSIRDASLNAARSIRLRTNAIAIHIERIVMFAACHPRSGKSTSDLKSLNQSANGRGIVSRILTLVAGSDIMAWARSASSLPKTGDPSPRGHPRTTHVTSPPHDSPFVRTALMATQKRHHLLTPFQSTGTVTINHFLSADGIGATNNVLLNLFNRKAIQIHIANHFVHSIDERQDLISIFPALKMRIVKARRDL